VHKPKQKNNINMLFCIYMNQEYKSREIKIFKEGKILSLGDLKTPKVVKLLNKVKLFKKEKSAGMFVEVMTVFCFTLSILLSLNLN
jgi:hypothetical protein